MMKIIKRDLHQALFKMTNKMIIFNKLKNK